MLYLQQVLNEIKKECFSKSSFAAVAVVAAALALQGV